MTIFDFKRVVTKTVVPPLSKLPYQLWPMSIRGAFIPIFMLHRFECKDAGLNGHSVKLVEQCFEFLRKNNFDIISIEEAVRIKREGLRLKRPTVSFSIDDGYWDQYEIGGELFQKFDCPATYFVSTALIDSDMWLWDLKINFILIEAVKNKKISDVLDYFNMPSVDIERAQEEIVTKLKYFSNNTINSEIIQLSEIVGIELPEKAPGRDKCMAWSDIIILDNKGMKIGPHSRFHNILTKLSKDEMKEEISGSWMDLKAKIASPSAIFCYPIGKENDFGEREIKTVIKSGMDAAVTAMPGSMNLKNDIGLYNIPRYSFPHTLLHFKQYATWVEEYKAHFRKNNKNVFNLNE